MVAAIQSRSLHPVARAFHQLSPQQDSGVEVLEMKTLPGLGVEAVLREGGRTFPVRLGHAGLLGSHQQMEMTNLRKKLRASSGQAMELWVLQEGSPVAVALLKETLRDSGRACMEVLSKLGLRVEIMSGDRPERLASLGFPGAHAGLLPEEKAQRITAMQHEGRRVLFVGDGVNDAPAMTVATASLALASGADLTGDAAQGRLYGGDLMMIPSALALSRQVSRGIRRNLIFAGCYNVLGMTLAAAGILHPVVAALLMLASSVTVTWRALRFGDNVEKALQDVLNKSEQLGRTIQRSSARSRSGQQRQPKTFDWMLGALFWAQGWMIVFMAELRGWWILAVLAVFSPAGLGAGATFRGLARAGPASSGVRYAGSGESGYDVRLVGGRWLRLGRRSRQLPLRLRAFAHGHGQLWSPSWMQGGMLLASLPLAWGAAIFPASTSRRNWKQSKLLHALVCLGGMMAGMWLSEWFLLGVTWNEPLLHFAASYLGMTTGMILGMTICCQAYVRWAGGNES
ncbi:MAG: cation-translocating P-type ATPase [Blastochloris sp.]|nr:cation-translocating P-type ATPase [Blastochloris sp.]